MFERIAEFFAALPRELYVFIISMLPLIELRGSVPVGAAIGLPFYLNFIVSVVGNLLPVPFILLFIPRILDWLGKFKLFAPMVSWLRKKAASQSHKVLKNPDGEKTDDDTDGGDGGMSTGIFVGLLLFVALPVPGTGAWSGALIAALFSLPKRKSFIAIALGVIVCGTIMCLASYGILEFLSFLL